MILEMDIGNTRTKWRCRKADSLSGVEALLTSDVLEGCLPNDIQPEAVHVASVASPEHNDFVRDLCRSVYDVEPSFAFVMPACAGVRHAYPNGKTLGVDRWLSMLAAYNASDKSEALCVVSSGTALTLDYVTRDGQHQGGYIVPGLALQRSVLLTATQRIECEDDNIDIDLLPANNTQDAVNKGIVMSQVGLLMVSIDRFAHKHGGVSLVMTGGAASVLAHALTEFAGRDAKWRNITVQPSLVLDGLRWAVSSTIE